VSNQIMLPKGIDFFTLFCYNRVRFEKIVFTAPPKKSQLDKPTNENDEVRTGSYLVHLWRDSRQSGWRASLQQVRTGQTRHFARPEALWAFLQAEMDEDDGRSRAHPERATRSE
jgi:hypothetical protein